MSYRRSIQNVQGGVFVRQINKLIDHWLLHRKSSYNVFEIDTEGKETFIGRYNYSLSEVVLKLKEDGESHNPIRDDCCKDCYYLTSGGKIYTIILYK
jgi:hypothetical protein